MAIFHFSAKIISRASGRSAVAAAAYRSADRLHDERLDRDHDFSNKSGVVHSEVMLPDDAPERLSDREKLWNEVEVTEKRRDAQLSREVEFAIPREMNQQQGIELARDFVSREFVNRGMIADLNVHWDIGADGRFVEGWQQLQHHRENLQRGGDFKGARKVSEQMAGMAKSLERDAQMESLLRPRRGELGIEMETGRSLARDLAASVPFEHARDLGMSR